ncbi:MAG: hypothetical protein AAFZ15_08550 [Bacteroidota bacterium]
MKIGQANESTWPKSGFGKKFEWIDGRMVMNQWSVAPFSHSTQKAHPGSLGGIGTGAADILRAICNVLFQKVIWSDKKLPLRTHLGFGAVPHTIRTPTI